MTTVVYDCKCLVSDSQSTVGEEIYGEDCQKIFPDVGPFAVLGVAGNYQDSKDVIDVISDYTKIEQILGLDFKDLEWNCSMIAITYRGEIWHYTGKYSFELRQDIPFAIGSGAPYALGAIHAGADAKQAVLAAARYDLYTNDLLQVAQLTGPEESEETEEPEEPNVH